MILKRLRLNSENKIKLKGLSMIILVFLLGFFIFQKDILAKDDESDKNKDIMITEIMYNPEGGSKNGSDWVELFAKEDFIINSEWGVMDEFEIKNSKDKKNTCHKIKDKKGEFIKKGKEIKVEKGEYIIFAGKVDKFKEEYFKYKQIKYSGKIFNTTLNLKKSGGKDAVRISDDRCDGFIDEVKYNPKGKEKVEKGYSLELDNKKWRKSYVLGGTPGEENSKKPKPKKYEKKIRINEILPNPKGEEKTDEFIELYNYGKKEINLNGWILKDSSKSGKYIFPKDEKNIIKAGDFFKIYRKDFKFALNNSGKETVYLLNPNKEPVFKISYKGAKENVSYGFDEVNKRWRWSRFLTLGIKNKFDKLPKIKIDMDDDIYKNTYADFEAKIKNINNKNDLKVRWDFGDGRKSYKIKTRHKYEKEGTYEVITKIFNGSEEFEIKNAIKVKKFPRRDIEIMSFMPNPKGKDIENEWIEIANNSKKRINFKNWSIATGKDKKSLINHPINEKFLIKSGKTKKINREYSLFSLNNKEGYIEIRYPDGKVACKASYKNKDGIKDDDIYKRNEDGNWEWIVSADIQIKSNSKQEEVKIVKEKIIISEDFLDIGKKSWIVVDKNIIFFNNYELNKEIIDFIWKSKMKIREESGIYYFNSITKKEKHYLIKFFEDIKKTVLF